MNRLSGLLTRLHRTMFRRKFESEMAEELRLHIETETERRVMGGEDPKTARRRAAAEFGSIDARTEEVRDGRLGRSLEEVWHNIRYALRGLRKSPGFTLVAIATIAIGIGASTAVFSLVNAILLKTLPVPHPGELRIVHWSGEDVRVPSLNHEFGETIGNYRVRPSFNHPTFLGLREQLGDRGELFGYFPLNQITARSGQRSFAVTGQMVSDNFFSGLQVRPFIGRLLQTGDDTSGDNVAVISHELWRSHFTHDPGVLGRSLRIRGLDYTIVGVLPAGFHGIRPSNPPGIYIPMADRSPFLYTEFSNDWHWFIRLMARIPGSQSDAPITAALSTAFGEHARERMTNPQILLKPGAGGLGFDRRSYGQPLVTMLIVTGLVMLVACANLAGLSLARGASRQHEFALRVALGAGRRRLIRQSLTESAVLAFLGGIGGILIATWGRHAISRLLAGSTAGLNYDPALDQRVLGFSVLACLLTILLAGLLPALRAGRADPLAGLKSRGSAGGPHQRTGRVLVVAQICLSLALLTGATLGLRSLNSLRQIDTGFKTSDLVTFQLNPASSGYQGAARVDYYDRVLASLEAVPGISHAALMQIPLLADTRSAGGVNFTTKTLTGPDRRYMFRQTVNESFFETLQIPLLKGRHFNPADDGESSKVIIVNQSFVDRYLPEEDPLGHVIRVWDAEWRIVGVVADARYQNIKEDFQPTSYFPMRQRFYGRFIDSSMDSAVFVVRSPLPPDGLNSTIIKAVATVDPAVPVMNVSTMQANVNHNIGREKLLATLGTALAAVALLLCCIGLYGLIAFEVTRRSREFAIRVAVGAQARDVVRPILGDALRLVLIGLGAGLPVVFGLSHLIRSQLYEVSPFSPGTWVGVGLLLVLVGLSAAWLPARRAGRADPIEALRSE